MIGVPGQLFAVGVMVNVTVTGALVELVSVPLILPEPLAAIPVTGPVLSLVQLKVVEPTAPLNTMVVMAVPLQIVCDDGVATAFGVGFTSTVAVVEGPVQPFAVAVMVKVTVIGALVVFVNVPLILPEPFDAIPVTVTVLSRVQLNVLPLTPPDNTICVIDDPEQIVCDDGVAIAFGDGFTSTVAVIGVPVQVAPALV